MYVCTYYFVSQEIAKWSLMCASEMIEHRKNSWELYGFDFMVDDDYNAWLIEINSSPACDYSTKVTEVYVQKALVTLPSFGFIISYVCMHVCCADGKHTPMYRWKFCQWYSITRTGSNKGRRTRIVGLSLAQEGGLTYTKGPYWTFPWGPSGQT